tara:strand:- start:20 stop:205 length:186 start_codon:yes stop_codon:yes gene_type:complete
VLRHFFSIGSYIVKYVYLLLFIFLSIYYLKIKNWRREKGEGRREKGEGEIMVWFIAMGCGC